MQLEKDSKQSFLYQLPLQKTWVLWLALALACFLLFGDAYAFDNPMALQSTIQTEMNLNNIQFNMLYSIYSAPNIILPFFGGILIDKIGVRVSILIFSSILILGQSIVVIGGYTLSYGTMLAGRCIFGIGSESLNAAQAAIMSQWFQGGQVSLALGLCLSIPKLGSAMNSLVSPKIQANHGELGFTFLIGLFIVIFSWGCGLILIFLDKKNEQLMIKWKEFYPEEENNEHKEELTTSQEMSLQIRKSESTESDRSISLLEDEDDDNDDDEKEEETVHEAKEEIKLSDLKHLDGSYWILSCIIMLSEALFVPFLDNGNAFFQVKFGFSQQSAGVLLTIPYVFAACVTPFVGIYGDKIRQRSLLIVLTTIIFIITHLCLLLIYCDSACGVSALPLLSLGICYSFYSAILIPSIPLVVRSQMIGTAFGLLGVMQNTALAIFPLITGSLYNSHLINEEGQVDPFQGYVYQSYFFVGVSCFNFVIAISLYVFDKNGSKKLSRLKNNSLADRKKSKSKQKTAISQRKNSDTQDNNFYYEFQIFQTQAQTTTFTKFEYMKEFFNLGLTEFPTDEEINQIQLEILATSGWNSNLKKNWTLNEKKVLIWLVGKLSQLRNEDLRDLSAELFEEVSKMICRRDKEQCKQKWAQMQKVALQQQPFRPEEDKKLYEIIMQYQSIDQGQKWSLISQELNQNSIVYRSSKQCRERWLNHLNPKISNIFLLKQKIKLDKQDHFSILLIKQYHQIKIIIYREPWTDDEDIELLTTVKEMGRRWAEISKVMDGRRSENNLKNRFNSLIKREKDLPYLQTQNGSATNFDDLLSGCTGPEITDLQRQVIEAVLTKLKWRSSETQNKNNHKKSIEIQQQEHQNNNNIKSTIQQQISYTIGNIEQEQNIQSLTPCLVNVDKNIIYFCTPEFLEQFLDFHQQKQQQQFKDHLHRIKSEFHIFDTGFHNFKSTLSMIEEIEDSQRSHLNLYTNDLDGFFNLETPDTFSKPVFVNPIEIITHSAIKCFHRWKTDSQLNDRRRNSIILPRSLPNLIQNQT